MEYILEAIILVSLIFLVIYTSDKGRMGERNIARRLKNLSPEQYIVLNNIMLNTNNALTQIDHIVVSIYGIFVVETKNFTGWITGTDYSDNWSKIMYSKKYHFRNPLKQNYAHIQALTELLGFYDDSPLISIVAFSENATLKVKTNQNVVYFKQLIECIASYNQQIFSYQDISAISQIIISENVDSYDTRQKHVEQINSIVRQKNQTIQAGICPRCGKNLVLRNGKYGEFYGCSNYPKCRFTNHI